MPETVKKIVRANDFRYVASDAIGFQFNDDIIKIVLGMEDINGTILEQSGIMLSHSAGKLLLIMLQESLRRYEQRSGREVPLNPAKVEEVMSVFAEADAAMATALTVKQAQDL